MCKVFFKLLLSFSFVLFLSCTINDQKEFLLIFECNSNKSELVTQVKEFEINHPDHFESKLFLAEYYISIGDVDSAFDYLKRAEIVNKKASRDYRDFNYSRLYGYLASVYVNRGEVSIAEDYVNKAICYDKNQISGFEYLLGHIYVLKGEKDKALTIFNDIYSKRPDIATASDLQTYMYLLAEAEDYQRCIEVINVYFGTGQWFGGLGSFSSSVFEKAGMLQESLLCAFLEYEYYSSMTTPNNEKYLENIANVEKLCRENGTIDTVLPVLSLIKNLYTGNEILSDEVHENFITKYLILRNKINAKKINEEELGVLLSLESYFRVFPSYYWSVWESIKIIDGTQSKNYISVLKKVIALNPSSDLSVKARGEIKDIFGLSNSESTDLDLLLFNQF